MPAGNTVGKPPFCPDFSFLSLTGEGKDDCGRAAAHDIKLPNGQTNKLKKRGGEGEVVRTKHDDRFPIGDQTRGLVASLDGKGCFDNVRTYV